jgi:tetratricopeptide (TPR) repeat protein
VRFSPDGRWLATGTEKIVALWEPRTQRAVVRVERPPGATRPAALDFTKDGKAWAVAWSDTRVRMLDLNGRTIADFEPPQQQTLVGLAFTPDGSRLVCATAARTVLVWNLGAVADELARLHLDNGFKLAEAAATPVSDLRSLSVEVGAFDRLRFSQAKQVLSLRRELGDLTDLLRREPGETRYYQHRAERYRAVGEYDKAIADYLEWIRLDQAASPLKRPKDPAWPFRDLAMLYISGPPGVQNFEKARALTQEALKLDAENADNHFRHGLACYRLGRIEEAERSLDAARKAWVAKSKPVTVVLFYQAMCQARQQNRAQATQLLQLARQDYALRDLKYRESHVEELADLVWEAERVVGELEPGG